MIVESFELGPVMTNAYLIYEGNSQEAVIVDPGMSPTRLLQRIKQLKLKVQAILLTHAHFDHIGGVEEVRNLTGAPVYIHNVEKEWLTNPNLNGSGLWPGIPTMAFPPAEHILSGGEVLTFFGKKFQVIFTPGHSPGSISFFTEAGVFSGDALFEGSIGRTDLPGGDHATLMKSIKDHFLKMSDETRVFPGHGPETQIGKEKRQNPFLR